MEIRTVDAEREAIVAILAPQLAVLHHKASGYDLNFVLFSGTGQTADLAKRYTAEALTDLFSDVGIRLVISDDIDLQQIAKDVAAQQAAADQPATDGAPTMQRATSTPLDDGQTLEDVAPALIHKPTRDTTDNSPFGRLMGDTDPQAVKYGKEAFAAMNPREKAYHFIRRMITPLLERQGCAVMFVDNGKEGLQEPTKVTLHIELPTGTTRKGKRK